MIFLGIETSCDETAAAVVTAAEGPVQVLASVVSSQVARHAPFGGVVPEIATREHLQNLPALVLRVLAEAGKEWNDIDGMAVTTGPGLAPALLVGYSYARGAAAALGVPCFGVNHLEGHLFSPFSATGQPVVFPFVGLIVSGGHTLLILAEGWGRYRKLGGTVDDAAGEVFDKVARMLGLPYPGGPEVERRAREGNPAAVEWPQSFPEKDNYQFSFSGVKTAVRYYLEKHPETIGSTQAVQDVCASFQEAVVQVLVRKAGRAARMFGANRVAVSGGVACNSRLRQLLEAETQRLGQTLFLAPTTWCTDNAAMITTVAAEKQQQRQIPDPGEDINPNLALASVA